MWNVARIGVNLSLTCVFQMQQYFYIVLFFTCEFNKRVCVWLLVMMQVPAVSGKCAL